MRIILSILCLFCYVLTGNTQDCIIGTYKDGRPFFSGNAMLEKDTCYFHLSDGHIADWKLLNIGINNDTTECFSKKNCETFEICVKDHIIGGMRYDFTGDSSTYYKGLICCYLPENNMKDTIEVLFNLLPSKPKFTNICFTCTGYDFSIFPPEPINPKMKLSFVSDRADGNAGDVTENGIAATLAYTYLGPGNIPFEDCYIVYGDTYQITKEGDDSFSIVSNFWETDQAIWIYTKNKYGASMNSATLITNNFITNPDVLEIIGWTSEIRQTQNSEEELRIKIHNGQLTAEGPDIKKMEITTLAGVKIKETNNSTISIHNMAKAPYIIRIMTSTNKVLTKKIML